MDYRVRSRKDRKIESVINDLFSRITLGKPPRICSSDSPAGEAVKCLSDEKREILKEAKTRYFQNYPNK